uniref:Uncharacterized protein n=1 Tax=Rhizophora mucronata TaxID=61149 RepID=A0A2P2ISV8_RHIMU
MLFIPSYRAFWRLVNPTLIMLPSKCNRFCTHHAVIL